MGCVDVDVDVTVDCYMQSQSLTSHKLVHFLAMTLSLPRCNQSRLSTLIHIGLARPVDLHNEKNTKNTKNMPCGGAK
jgi:hypothetical protein